MNNEDLTKQILAIKDTITQLTARIATLEAESKTNKEKIVNLEKKIKDLENAEYEVVDYGW